MAEWLGQPWHKLYSALRCMACQDWQCQRSCPICRAAYRNNGGTHDAWSYFNGCITHLGSALKCIGSLLLENTLMLATCMLSSSEAAISAHGVNTVAGIRQL